MLRSRFARLACVAVLGAFLLLLIAGTGVLHSHSASDTSERADCASCQATFLVSMPAAAISHAGHWFQLADILRASSASPALRAHSPRSRARAPPLAA